MEIIFITSIDSRPLPQNKAPFGYDLLAKFRHFTRKSVPTIRSLLSQTEGTITMRKSRGTYWDLEPVIGVAEDGDATAASQDVAICVARAATAVDQPPRS